MVVRDMELDNDSPNNYEGRGCKLFAPIFESKANSSNEFAPGDESGGNEDNDQDANNVVLDNDNNEVMDNNDEDDEDIYASKPAVKKQKTGKKGVLLRGRVCDMRDDDQSPSKKTYVHKIFALDLFLTSTPLLPQGPKGKEDAMVFVLTGSRLATRCCYLSPVLPQRASTRLGRSRVMMIARMKGLCNRLVTSLMTRSVQRVPL